MNVGRRNCELSVRIGVLAEPRLGGQAFAETFETTGPEGPPMLRSATLREIQIMEKRSKSFAIRKALGALAVGASTLSFNAIAAEPTVIELTQVGCQFIESENGVDHQFSTTKAADCEAINERTGNERLGKAKVFQLKPGKYVFKVTNKNVPYSLGFWVRGDGVLNRARLPSVSGGGLTPGTTKDYHIDLQPGEYVYSCPLNPTPNYKLVVSG